MPPLTPAALRTQILAGATDPLYMLVGEDEAEKAAVAVEFGQMVDEGLRAFNVERMHGGETTADALAYAAATLPMMAPRRVVIVLEAEKLLIPKRETKASEADQERLGRFIEQPPAHASVVFVCGPLDERRRTVKLLKKHAHVVDCGTIADQGDAEQWVKIRAARLGVPLDPGAVRALAQRAGLDVARLRAGLDRIALYALGEPAVTAEDVRQAVPAAPDAPADWGVADAIARNDAAGALRELHAALDAGDVPVKVLGQIRVAAERLPPRRLPAALDALLRTDIALKSSGGDPRTLLERLVVELCEERASARPSLRGSRETR